MSAKRNRDRWLVDVKRFIPAILLVIAMVFVAGHYVHRRPALHHHAAKILVLKTQHQLLLLDENNNVVREYAVALGTGGLEPKQQEGDGRTPEGLYIIDRRKKDSQFFRALHISYPNESDRARALTLRSDPGGNIMIHGMRNGLGWIGPFHRVLDWTSGCIAVTDTEMEEIWSAVPDGIPVEIRH